MSVTRPERTSFLKLGAVDHDDVTEVARGGTGVEERIAATRGSRRDEVDPHVELLLDQLREPALHQAGLIGELVVELDSHLLAVVGRACLIQGTAATSQRHRRGQDDSDRRRETCLLH